MYSDGEAAKKRTWAVLVYVFKSMLRLIHAFMPYVTEELWGAMPRSEGPLIVSKWPSVGAYVDSSSVEKFEALQVTFGCCQRVQQRQHSPRSWPGALAASCVSSLHGLGLSPLIFIHGRGLFCFSWF